MKFDEERVQWHFAVWEWLLSNFGGMAALERRPLITPTANYFPHRQENSHAYAEQVFDSVKGLMDIADWPCSLEPLADETPGTDLIQRHMLEGQWSTHGAAGTFQWSDEGVVIRYAPRKLGDSTGTVATMVHELCHYLLATARSDPPGGWTDHELHTDIACSFMGFGIFQCNSAFAFRQWTDGQQSGWQSSTQGYLSESEHAYALALFCILTDSKPDEVLPFLKTNPKAYFKLAWQDLRHRGEELNKLRATAELSRSATLPEANSELHPGAGSSDRDVFPTLSLDEVRNLSFRNPEHEPLWQCYLSLLQLQTEEWWHEKEFGALRLLPERLRNMVLIVRFEVLQRNEGLQGTALLDGPQILADSERMLRMTAAAFSAFNDTRSSQFVLGLIPLISEHLTRLDAAENEGELDDFVSPLDLDEIWMSFGYPYVHELRRQVRDHAAELVFPAG